MRKVLAWSGVALLAMSAIGTYRWPAEAQGIDPGIAAIVSALKAPLTVTTVPTTGNGWTPFLANNLGTTVVTAKGSAGALGAYHCLNPNASAAMCRFSTPRALSLGLPASDGGNLEWSMGIHFANGIKVATTTATGSTANGANPDCNFAYK